MGVGGSNKKEPSAYPTRDRLIAYGKFREISMMKENR